MKADIADGEYTNIADAIDSMYEVQAGDKFIKVKFTATGSYTGTPVSEVIVVEVAKVESVSAVNATTIEVTFEGVEEPVEIKLEKALVHGENEVTFTYEDQEFTATVNYVDEDVVALEEATKAVKTAEETRLAADITTARELVNKLKASEAKAALEDRLNKITPVLEAPADGLQQLEVEGVTADGALFLVAGLGKDGGKAQTPSTLAEVKAFIEDKYKVAFNSEHIVVTDGKIEVTGSILSQDDWNKVKADGNKKMPYRITLVRDNSVVGETGKDSGKQVAKVAMYEDGKAVVEKVEKSMTATPATSETIEIGQTITVTAPGADELRIMLWAKELADTDAAIAAYNDKVFSSRSVDLVTGGMAIANENGTFTITINETLINMLKEGTKFDGAETSKGNYTWKAGDATTWLITPQTDGVLWEEYATWDGAKVEDSLFVYNLGTEEIEEPVEKSMTATPATSETIEIGQTITITAPGADELRIMLWAKELADTDAAIAAYNDKVFSSRSVDLVTGGMAIANENGTFTITINETLINMLKEGTKFDGAETSKGNYTWKAGDATTWLITPQTDGVLWEEYATWDGAKVEDSLFVYNLGTEN